MTLLARRREELARAHSPHEPVEKTRSVAARPPQPRPSFLHLQAALGNHASSELLLASAETSERRGRPLDGDAASNVELHGAAAHPRLDVALRLLHAPRPALLVADGGAAGRGQMSRSDFLAAMRDAARAAAEEALTGTRHTARDCPWIEHYFRFYQGQSAERIEADLRRYVPAARAAADVRDLVALAAEHVGASVRHWAATGELRGVPRSLPGTGLLRAVAGSSAAAIQAQLGAGRPLDPSARGRMERAFGTRFDDVRLHTDAIAARLARRERAPAFAVGRHVAFDRGRYRPGTLAGDALLAHELAHVRQQAEATPAAPVRGAAPALERDADSAAVGAVARLWARGRALPAGLARPARPRLRAGLSLQRCTPNSDQWFLPYRQRFNELWNVEPYASKNTAFDPGLSSKGPRTEKSRAIFERLYVDDAELREAYDDDKGGLRERIDTYTGPEGLNLIESPRLTNLERVFGYFKPPVSGPSYEALKRAISGVAATLTEDDREAIRRSNEWDRLFNRYFGTGERKREILRLINPTVAPADAPAPEGTPEEALTQEQKVRRFIDRWRASLQFKRGLDEPTFFAGTEVRYEGNGQLFRVNSSSAIANPGQVLYVRVRVSRGAAVIASPDPQLFPAGQTSLPPIIVPVRAPSPVPPAGDVLVFTVELLEADLTTVRGTPARFEVTVQDEVPLTQATVEGIAAADNAFLNDTTAAGLLGIMRAQGGIPRNVAQNITMGYVTLRALTERHDSGVYVETQLHRPDPSKVGYFAGPDYSKSFVDVPADAFRIPNFGPRFIAVNRTPDLRRPATKRPNARVIGTLVHETVHALDVRPDSDTPLERYKTEFRAYWMDGSFGPPLEGTCPPGDAPARCTDLSHHDCFETSYCAELPVPGPKTPRSRKIFKHLYGSPTYEFVKENYDENADGFRQAVDQYVIPDGINLIASVWLAQLQAIIADWDGSSFEALRRRVLYWTAPAPRGRLSEEERAQIRGNRAWRALVERKVRFSVYQRILLRDLGIVT